MGAQFNTRVVGELPDPEKSAVVYLSPLAYPVKKDSAIADKGSYSLNTSDEKHGKESGVDFCLMIF